MKLSGQDHATNFISKERSPIINWIVGYVDHRAGLDLVQREKFLLLLGTEPQMPSQIESMLTYLLQYTCQTLDFRIKDTIIYVLFSVEGADQLCIWSRKFSVVNIKVKHWKIILNHFIVIHILTNLHEIPFNVILPILIIPSGCCPGGFPTNILNVLSCFSHPSYISLM